MTIHDAAMKVIKDEGRPLSVDEVLAGIQQRSLYEFKTKSPRGVVASAIRKRCQDVHQCNPEVAGSRSTLFKAVGGRRFDVC